MSIFHKKMTLHLELPQEDGPRWQEQKWHKQEKEAEANKDGEYFVNQFYVSKIT